MLRIHEKFYYPDLIEIWMLSRRHSWRMELYFGYFSDTHTIHRLELELLSTKMVSLLSKCPISFANDLSQAVALRLCPGEEIHFVEVIEHIKKCEMTSIVNPAISHACIHGWGRGIVTLWSSFFIFFLFFSLFFFSALIISTIFATRCWHRKWNDDDSNFTVGGPRFWPVFLSPCYTIRAAFLLLCYWYLLNTTDRYGFLHGRS